MRGMRTQRQVKPIGDIHFAEKQQIVPGLSQSGMRGMRQGCAMGEFDGPEKRSDRGPGDWRSAWRIERGDRRDLITRWVAGGAVNALLHAVSPVRNMVET